MIDSTISVCLIVKNEEKSLSRCLNSVINIADEIVVVDTGSTDNTIEIAKKFGAKILFHQWNNNFSDARNKSLENATKNWILFLDADEEIPFEDSLKIKGILKQNSHIEAFHLRLVNIISGINAGDAIVLRIFKNNPKYRFRGRMHEQIVTSIEELNPPGCLGCTDIRLFHYGYDGNIYDMDKKQKRNLQLLESYPENDKDGYYYYSLANEYARIGQNDKALGIYETALNFPYDITNIPIYVPYLYSNMLKVLGNELRFADVIKLSQNFLRNFENFKDLYFYEALAYSQCGKFSESKECVIKYLNCPLGNYEYPDSNFTQQFNISEMVENLNKNSINKKNKFLSIIIMANKNDTNLEEMVKNLNEVAYEVIVVSNTDCKIDKEKIENVLGKSIKVNSKDKGELFIAACKECTCDFILLVKPNEFIESGYHQNIISMLESTEDDYFNIHIVDQINSTSSIEFRLYRNSNKLNSIDNFYDYEKYINSNISKTLPIYLFKNITN